MGSLRRGVINLRRFLTSSNPTASPLPRYSLSSPFSSLHIDLSDEESKRRLFNRLIYRSKQRGFLELDLVLGKWVEDNVHSLDENRLRALVHVLDLVIPHFLPWRIQIYGSGYLDRRNLQNQLAVIQFLLQCMKEL
ncbi:uncharacterized protein [Arachis hypogaea]|uniref:uncharacterized protein isoform X3 n=1 Tax=Arachis hypogaea TaxID=3818 RepID=UPI0010FC6279|nr:uncharacterized protein LOC112791016 isoform X3 [Arachis hypogaea]